MTQVVQGLEYTSSQGCWDVWSRVSGRCVAIEVNGCAGCEMFFRALVQCSLVKEFVARCCPWRRAERRGLLVW
jgi:hypothetical protein